MKKSTIAITAALSLGAGAGTSYLNAEYGNRGYIVMVKPGAAGGEGLEALAKQMGDEMEAIDGLDGYVVQADRNSMRSFSVPSEEYIIEPLIEYKLPDLIKSAALPGGCGFDPAPPLPEPPDTDGPQVIDWGIERVHAVQAFANVDASGISVCVLDTGIDKTHPDLRYEVGRNFSGGSADDFQDFQGHGSHTAGLVGATHNDYGVVGASQAKLLIGKVLDNSGSGYNSWISAGIVWCADAGADIISMSLGGPSPSQAIASALQYAIDSGAIIMAAAGNDGSDQVGYPAGYIYPDKLFSVSATNHSDGIAYFSNYGKVEMACPGVGILSTVPGGYDRFSGTSMATPICAGIMALYMAAGVPVSYDAIGDPYYFGAGMPSALGL